MDRKSPQSGAIVGWKADSHKIVAKFEVWDADHRFLGWLTGIEFTAELLDHWQSMIDQAKNLEAQDMLPWF